MRNVYALKQELALLRSELEKAISISSDYVLNHEDILKISCRLDELIVAYVRASEVEMD